MPKVYAHRKDFWVDGQRYVVRADTEEDLIRKEALKRQEIEEGRITKGGNTRVEDWIEECFATFKPNASEETLKNEMYRVKKHIVAEIGHMPIRKVTRSQLQKILNSQKGMSFSHVRSLRQELEFIFDNAVQEGLILKSPAVNLKMPPNVKGERRAITDEERRHLLKVCEKDEHFVLFLLMLYCGCRPGEARECRRYDIDEIGDGVHRLHIRGTKTENADRFVPLPEPLWQRFKDLPPNSPLAVNARGKKHSESSYNRLVDRLRREMNISMGCKMYRNKLVPPYPLADDFVPYCLRHTYCTDLAHARVDIRIAKTLMGHSNIMVTADIYTHAGDTLDEIRESAALLDAYYTKVGEQ